MSTRLLTICAAVAAACCALVALPGTSAAHVGTTGYSEIRHVGSDIRYRLGLEYEPLVTAAGFGTNAFSGTTEELTRDLRDGIPYLQEYIGSRIRSTVDGNRCGDPVILDAVAEERGGTTFAQLRMTIDCPADDGAYAIRFEIDENPDGSPSGHRNIADFELGDARGRFVFEEGHTLLEADKTSTIGTVEQFVTMGVEHILLGWDHVLFLLVLLLGARSLRSVVELATTFTVAHSVTLVLASVGWVHVNPDIVEPLIALSIAAVAIATILGVETRRQLAVVFAFGLLHGLGFAGTVDFDAEAPGRLFTSLVSFNVGIELGQAMIVAVVFPLLLFIRRYSWGTHAQVAGAACAAGIGVYWFAERMPL
jgi:hydrogenase/urease accessory protein HupE